MKNLGGAILFLLMSINSHAGTINFNEILDAGVPENWTDINYFELSNATVTSFGANFFISNGMGGWNGMGSIGACEGYYCDYDMQIDFHDPVENLLFYANAWSSWRQGGADSLNLIAYNGTDIVADLIYDGYVGAKRLIDLSSYGQITSLFLDVDDMYDWSDGLFYQDFSFDQLASQSVSEPSTFMLLTASMLLMGRLRRRSNDRTSSVQSSIRL